MSSDIYDKPSIGAALARRVIDAAVAEASTTDTAFTIALVDESGVLKAFHRMDGAPLLSVQIAQDKAYTAAGFGISTDAWHDFIKDDAPLADGATAAIDRLVVFGGGYPIVVDGHTVGGIGVSGGHYSDDMRIAQAGIAGI